MRKFTDKQKDRQIDRPYFIVPFWPRPRFQKENKTLGDIIILHLYTTNDDHMIYGS